MCETSEVKRYELSNKSCKIRFTGCEYNRNLKKNAKKKKLNRYIKTFALTIKRLQMKGNKFHNQSNMIYQIEIYE